MNKEVKIGGIYRSARDTKTLLSRGIWYYIYDIKDNMYYFLMVAYYADYLNFELRKVGKINAEALIFGNKDTKKADRNDFIKLVSFRNLDKKIIKGLLSTNLP